MSNEPEASEISNRPGFVSLVGAGPGDPQLITVGGLARIAEADVIIYDRLVNPLLLEHAKKGAELIDAGKLPERHTLTQDEINHLLVEHARAGKQVVRLKGGDPFVFGRGGEEAQELAGAGVAFEVIPGVTSAVAAAAYAGIPVTHRALASSFAVVTGHEDPTKGDTAIDWTKLATGVDTLVLLMGVGRLAEIESQLSKHGRDPSTPVAVIEWGTLPRQRTVVGTLATIAKDVMAEGIGSPAVTVVGEVVRLRNELRWFDARPLFGKRVLVTRTRQQASELSRVLAAEGAEPIELPAIEIVPSVDGRHLQQSIDSLRTSGYGWVIFTSVNGVNIFFDALSVAGFDARAFARARVAAIGSATADALRARGIVADIVPHEYVAEALADAVASRPIRGVRMLLPRAARARDALNEALASRGALVDELILYEARVPDRPDDEALRRLRAGDIEIATFASSSSVRNLIAMLDGDVSLLRGLHIAAIGPITAQTLTKAGLDVQTMPREHTIEGLVRALVRDLGAAPVSVSSRKMANDRPRQDMGDGRS